MWFYPSIGTQVTEEECKFIFQMFDADKDGVLKKEEIRLGEDDNKGKTGWEWLC